MTDKQFADFMRRELHAAIAMNALITASVSVNQIAGEGHELPPITDATIAARAYQVADAMLAAGGPTPGEA